MALVNNPLFARYFARFGGRNEERGNRELRQEMLAGLSGLVMEVGPGNGLNFPHYPVSVREVVAVEPEPYLRSRAVEAAAAAPVPIRIADGTADELPAADGSFDAVVVSGLLCSVADVPAALAEFHRVLRPGGATVTGMMPPDAVREGHGFLEPEVMGPPIVWLASDEAAGVHDERIVAAEFERWLRDRNGRP